MRTIMSFTLFLALTLSASVFARDATSQGILTPIDLKQVVKWNSPYEYRIASFAKDESDLGGGALVLLLSQDQRKALLNIQGRVTELVSVQKTLSSSCVAGETRQNVYSNGQIRLLLKLNMVPKADACLGQGLISVHIDKHTHRYLVKGNSAF